MDFECTDGGVYLPDTRIRLGGKFIVEHIRDGEVIDVTEDSNLIVNEGLDHVLDVEFNGATQITTWYIGIFEANYTPIATVTAATITSASTESIAYDEATREEYVEVAAASQSMTNAASKATFTINATKTMYGAFLVSASAKSATTGTLFAASQFSASKAVVATDQLLVTYQLDASSV